METKESTTRASDRSVVPHRRAGFLAGALVLLGVIVFTVWSVSTLGSGVRLPEFDRDQTDSDIPPSYATGDVDPSSTRYVGSADGHDFYLASPPSQTVGVCLISVDRRATDPASAWAAGCNTGATDSGTLLVQVSGQLTVTVGDWTPTPEGESTQLSESVTAWFS
jgi:hypothetical protein